MNNGLHRLTPGLCQACWLAAFVLGGLPGCDPDENAVDVQLDGCPESLIVGESFEARAILDGSGEVIDWTLSSDDGADADLTVYESSSPPQASVMTTAAGTLVLRVAARPDDYNLFSFDECAIDVTEPPECGTGLATVEFSDSDFAAEDWELETELLGGSAQTEQNTAGGNGGSWRQMTHILPPESAVRIRHFRVDAVYDPSADGPIGCIDYAEDQVQLEPPADDARVGANLVLQQDDRNFYLVSDLEFGGSGEWQSRRRFSLFPNQFVSDDGRNPDFDEGGPIRFGYVRSTTQGDSDSTLTYTHGIDNWQIRLIR